jgi:hypothetical protein
MRIRRFSPLGPALIPFDLKEDLVTERAFSTTAAAKNGGGHGKTPRNALAYKVGW